MATKADGTVKIDTKVETTGFNSGIRKISASAGTVLNKLLLGTLKIGTIIKTLVGLVAGLALGFLGLIFLLQTFGQRLFVALENGIDKTSEYYKTIQTLKQSFELLRGSVLSVFATILQAATPVLLQITNWLVGLIDKVNMLIGALLGQKTVLKAIVKTTQEQKKAQEGVLAAFDQINVLQQKQADEKPDTNPITFQSVPIDEKTLTLVEKIKNVWLAAINAITTAWQRFVKAWNDFWKSPLGETIQRLWTNFTTTWKAILNNSLQTFLDIKAGIIRIFNGIIEFITGIFTGDWKLVFKGLQDIAGGTWDVIFAIVKGTLTNIMLLLTGNVNAIKIIFDGLAPFFANLWLLLSKGFNEAIAKITIGWTLLWNGMALLAKSFINVIIDFVNGMIRAVIAGINSAITAINTIQFSIPSWIPIFGGQSIGFNIPKASAPQIPRLAQGAIIPPNAQFLALLGDQKSGTNIETPENLLRQIVREETGSQNQVINLTATLDGEVIYKNQQRVSLRKGKSLVVSGNTA